MVTPWKPLVVLGLPAVPNRRPMPEREISISTGILVKADEVVRELPVVPVQGPISRRQPRVPTGILAKADELVVPVVLPPQYQKKVDAEAQEETEEEEALLPEGTPLLSVAGEELPKSAVGPALEFLEFCSAFYEPLGMKKLEAEKTLHEVANGCKLKIGSQSQVAQVHVRLLSVILDDSDEPCNVSSRTKSKSSWLEVLKNYLYKKTEPRLKDPQLKDAEDAESKALDADAGCLSKPSPPLSDSVASASNSTFSHFQESMLKYAVALEGGADGYLSLGVEEKLQLFNMLCNDALSTAVIRGHIEKVMVEYDEKRKEERKMSMAAKKKAKLDQEKQKESLVTGGKDIGVKTLEQQSENISKLRAGELKASTSEPSTEDERTGTVLTRSALKRESANVLEHLKTSDSCILGDTGSETLRSDAVKTEAIVWNNGSRALWKLKGGDDRTAVIFQVISDIEGTPKEEWTVYSEKDKETLAVYLDQKKNGQRRARKRYQLKTLRSHPVTSMDVGIDAMELASAIKDDANQELAVDGDSSIPSSSSDDRRV